MKNNPKFNWLIRFTLEVFVILAGVALALSRTGGGAPPEHQPPPLREQTGHSPGVGRDVATVTVHASQAAVEHRGQTAPLSAAVAPLMTARPDHLVIKLRGAEWKALLDWALQQDRPVSVMAED